jgi:O-antigen ligase
VHTVSVGSPTRVGPAQQAIVAIAEHYTQAAEESELNAQRVEWILRMRAANNGAMQETMCRGLLGLALVCMGFAVIFFNMQSSRNG